MCGAAYSMYTPVIKLLYQNMYREVLKIFRWWGALLSSPIPNIFVPQRFRHFPIMTKICTGKNTHYIRVYTKSEGSISEAKCVEKWLWPIFYCSVGQLVPIRMKHIRRVALPSRCIYQVSNWYLKTCRKINMGNFENPTLVKITAKIQKIIVKKTQLKSISYQRSTYVPNLKGLFWSMKQLLHKIIFTYFWLYSSSKRPNCNESQKEY